jgi:signal transduction histidine kinase
MFRLVRYFSITSLAAFVIVVIILGAFYRQLAINDLIALRESSNAALTQTFANSLWPKFEQFVMNASELPPEQLAEAPEIDDLYAAVLAQMDGLSIIKIKVYNLDGLTVFSTEAAQIGQDKSANTGYLSARSGQVATELTHRDTFSAFEGIIEDRDVISSYVPIVREGTIKGVFEIYDDVTPLLHRIEDTQRNLSIGVILILSILYVVLFFIVRHGDNIIQQQRRERERVEEALRQARDEALAALRFKQQILANISHDARTPITVITLYTEMLQNQIYGPLNEKQHSALDSILVSTRQLLFFFTTLLDEAQLNAGKIVLRDADFAPSDLLKNVEINMKPLADKKTLVLSTQLAAGVPSVLRGDPDRLEQILMNLVNNAIKFTDAGAINVNLYCPDDQHWAFAVSDTGIGIAPEKRDQIFEAFWQVDGSTTRSVTTGVGLGLSIVRQLTELMKGQVSVQSEPGKGSTFIVTLPLKQGAPAE